MVIFRWVHQFFRIMDPPPTVKNVLKLNGTVINGKPLVVKVKKGKQPSIRKPKNDTLKSESVKCDRCDKPTASVSVQTISCHASLVSSGIQTDHIHAKCATVQTNVIGYKSVTSSSVQTDIDHQVLDEYGFVVI